MSPALVLLLVLATADPPPPPAAEWQSAEPAEQPPAEQQPAEQQPAEQAPPPAAAAEAPAPEETFTDPDSLTDLVVWDVDADDGWVEVTLLAAETDPVLLELGPLSAEGEPVVLHLPASPGGDRGGETLPAGPVLICSGGDPDYGTTCEEHYRGEVGAGAEPVVVVRFEPALEVRGRYQLGAWPVPGARVSVVPAGLDAFRAFTLPLAVVDHKAARELLTDGEGRFTIPGLGAGEYFLETLLPSGRVHRSDAFSVPERGTTERSLYARASDRVYFDLGTIDVADGLTVAFRVLDPAGEPIPGAAVSASQGRLPRDLETFEATSDADGRAALSGLDVEVPVRLGCSKEGFRPWQEDYELLPVSVDCVLERWATVSGEVLGPDSRPVPGARVTVWPVDGERREGVTAAADGGGFAIGELAAGAYDLRAAAPGFAVEKRAFVLAPGESLELGAIFLLFGRTVEGVVVDAESGEPLAGVEVFSVEPPGAAADLSDLDGGFLLTAPGEDEPLTVRFLTPDYAPREVIFPPAVLSSGDPVRVEMDPAGWILAVVEEPDGLPCQGCRVVIWPGGEELLTDALGEATSGPLAPGIYKVARPRVTHMGSVVVEQPGASYRRVRVSPKNATLVRMRDAERIVTVSFSPRLEGLWTLSSRSPGRREKHYPEADGGYRVGLREGEDVELYLQAWDAGAGAETMIWQATLKSSWRRDELRLELSPSRVRGRARGRGVALAGEPVRLKRFHDAELVAVVYTDADGRFEIPFAPPGTYTVMVGDRTVQFASVGERQRVDLGTLDLFLFDQTVSSKQTTRRPP